MLSAKYKLSIDLMETKENHFQKFNYQEVFISNQHKMTKLINAFSESFVILKPIFCTILYWVIMS